MVPLFSHPTHKNLAKEFFNSSGATWVILGTPESGCSVMACLELKLPVIAMCRNESHVKALLDLTKSDLKKLVLSAKTPFTSVALANKWAELGEDSSSRSSSEEEGPQAEEQVEAPKKKEKVESSQKKKEKP